MNHKLPHSRCARLHWDMSHGVNKEPVRPLVSATLIVRDEEKFLDGCLASLQGSHR